MSSIFEQKRGLNTRKHILLDDRIFVEVKTLRKNHKFEIKLDKIGHEIVYQSESTIMGKILFGVCLAIPFILITTDLFKHNFEKGTILLNCIVWFGLAAINYFKQHQDDIYLAGGQKNLVFWRAIPGEEKVLEFIHEIISASKKYLKEKCGTVDINIPEEVFLSNLYWLKEREVITETEFHELKNEYKFKKLL